MALNGRFYLCHEYGLKTDGLIFNMALSGRFYLCYEYGLKTDGLISSAALKRMVLSLLWL